MSTQAPSEPEGHEPCRTCGGLQYVTRGDGHNAIARVCTCVTTCTRCDGAGHVTERDADGYLVVRPCRCSYLAERVRLFNDARLPARYHRKSVEGYQHLGDNQNEIKYFVLGYRRAFRAGERGILFMGNPGTGKTHLLVALLSYFTLERGYRCRYVDFMGLLSELKDGYNQGKTDLETIGPLVQVPILAVDELGKGRNSDWEQAILDELISRRYNAQRTTFFATNYRTDPLPIEEPPAPRRGLRGAEAPARGVLRETLEDRVGPRIYSRLQEMCELRTVLGPDYRQLPKK